MKRKGPTLVQQQMQRIAGKLVREPTVTKVEVKQPTATLLAIEGGKKPPIKWQEILASARRREVDLSKDSPHNPFKFPAFPKAVEEATEKLLAQDSSLVEISAFGTAQWQVYGGQYAYGSAFFEGQQFLGYAYLAQLAQRPEYRKISERTALDMTRKWIRIQASGDSDTGEKADRIGYIEDELKRLNAQDKFRELAENDGFFGRSHLFFDFEDADEKELETSIGDGLSAATAAKVTKAHPLKAIRTVEPMWAYPMQYNANNPLAQDWYRPQLWNVMGKMVHRSRLLPIVGREVPDILKPSYAFGGLALSQMAKPYVDNWLRTRQSVSDTLHSFSTSGVKTDMSQMLTPGGNSGQDMFARLDLFNLLKDNRGLLALDKAAEEFFQFNVPLGTLDALQAQAQEQMASVVNMPLVVFLGIQPAGLNASSEGEIRIWYDFVEAMQRKIFSDPLTRLINFIQLSKFGNVDPKITFQYEPLWSSTDKERAEVDKFEAEADQIRIDSGVIHPIEVRASIAANPASKYPSLEVQDVPEPPVDNADAGVGTADKTGESDDAGEKKPNPAPVTTKVE